jgi:predicted CXXCH cytochrome family protein
VTIRNYIAAIFLITLVLLISACNSGTNPVAPATGVLRYISADICAGCHIQVGNQWKLTKHADALPALLTSSHVSSSCYPCHVVGLDGDPSNSGYDDPDPTVAARFGGVQCESCHGAGSEHVATLIPLVANVSAEVCGQCHTGAHNPNYDDWETSLHAQALELNRDNSHFSVGCLECHSADYIFADSVPEDATVDDFQFGITCVVCHDPHSPANEFQLRADPVTLCTECHNTEGAVVGESAHHPNGDMFAGSGGYEYPGYSYVNSAHTNIEDGCVACHMWASPFNATGSGENAISGHSFRPVIQACQECHPDATDFDIFGAQTNIQALLNELKAKLDAATDNDKLLLSYERAKFNYGFVSADGSLGIHNYKYAAALLQDAIDNFEPGS